MARTLARIALGAAAAVAILAWMGRAPAPVGVAGPRAPQPLPAERAFSFFALGDTGEILPWRSLFEGQRSVARALARADRADPVDALVLLGDNFYADGLEAHELVERVRLNLVRPYCRFADLSGPRSAEVESACELPTEDRNAVPILAVLGNHDWNAQESPGLQRDAVPQFLSNWSVTRDVADVVELAPGISLVRVDSELVRRERSVEPVRRALAQARGPWRILVIHEPIAPVDEPQPARWSFDAEIRRAIAESGAAVQLVLSGHRHNLQLVTLPPSSPGLQVISGGGSGSRPFRDPSFSSRVFGVETTGFARVDLLRDAGREGLLVSLYTAPAWPILVWERTRLVSQWWVEPGGAAHQVVP